MLLVVLSWSYVLLSCFSLGFTLDKMIGLRTKDFPLFIFFGLFGATFIGSVWAIFGRVNIEFHAFLLLFNLLILFRWKRAMIDSWRGFFNQLKTLPLALKSFMTITTLIVTALCSAPSYFIDNEIYYIQTIKWLNEYGFVKGLANLHLFFGQTGGWHIAQSVFNFSFLGFGLNNLNGFCLWIGIVYGLTKWNSPSLLKYLPMASVLFFPFVGIPSPALSIGIISFVLFCKVAEEDMTLPENFNLVLLLSAFIAYLKITALPIIALPFILYLMYCRRLRFKVFSGFGVALFTGLLLVVKNQILTGYPLFPSQVLSNFMPSEFALPKPLYDFAFNRAKMYDFVVSRKDYEQLSAFRIFFRWLFGSGKNSFFNAAIVGLTLIVPFFIRRFFNQKKYWVLYGVMVLQLLFLLATSPQYRFMLHFAFFFGILIVSVLVRHQKQLVAVCYLSLLPMTFMLICPFEEKLNDNSIAFRSHSFSRVNLLVPYPNSNLQTTYQPLHTGNLQYFSPDEKTYFWATGDGQLPCVNQKQIQYFERKFGYRPQQRTADLKDGFYSQKVTDER